MSRRRGAAPAPAPAPIARGARVGGFVIRRVLRTDPGAWTVADAVQAAHPHTPAVLWVSAPGAAGDRPLRDLFDRLAAVRSLCESSDLPVVAPLASGIDRTRLFLARPQLRGTTLAERLRVGPLAPGDAVRVASGVARALDALHAFAIPHAPLTPRRILLTPEERLGVKLYDYGLPRAPARACADEGLLAAVDQLAPEVARGAASTIAADVYALACVIVECLTGAPPFPYDRPLRVLHAHTVERPRGVAAATGVPAEVDHVLARALHKIPERRPRTAASLTRALRRALDGMTPAAAGEDPPPAGTAAVTVPAEDPAPARGATAPVPAESSGAAIAALRSEPSPPATATRRSLEPEPTPGPTPGDTPARARRRLPVSAAVAVTLLLAAAAGFTASRLRPDDTAGPRPATVAPAATAPRSASVSAPGLAHVVRRLDAQRARRRRALAAADSAAGQARAAEALASAYAAARDDTLAAVPGDAVALRASLGRAQGAYHRLAAAALSGDGTAYRSAVAQVLARERDAARALRETGG